MKNNTYCWANVTKFRFWPPFGSFLWLTDPIICIVSNRAWTTILLCHCILCFLSSLEQYTKLPQCSCSKVCRQFVPGEPQPMHAPFPAELWFSAFCSHSWSIVCYLLHQQGKGHAFTVKEKNRGWGRVKLASLVLQLLLLGRGEGDDWKAHRGEKILRLRNPERRISQGRYHMQLEGKLWLENRCPWKGCNVLSIRGLPQVNKPCCCNFVSWCK